jgi:hypothetical protein
MLTATARNASTMASSGVLSMPWRAAVYDFTISAMSKLADSFILHPHHVTVMEWYLWSTFHQPASYIGRSLRHH